MDRILTQGLHADHLVTQGWSSGTLSPSLVSQGLGGPQVLLQGLVGSGGIVAVSASGGLNLGGHAGAKLSAGVMPSGGMTRGGGLAPVAMLHPSPRGGMSLGAQPGSEVLGYHVYANTGAGDPINYAVCLATVAGQSWTSPVLNAPCHFKMGVRAFDAAVGLEEQNVDAVIELILDINGNDVTRTPAPPLGLRAFPIAGGIVRIEWTCPCGDSSRQPLGFHVYLGTGSVPDYTLPVSTVAWSDARYGCFSAELVGAGNGGPCSIAVRSYNTVAEEPNATVLHVTPDDSPPSVVDSLAAVATNQEP